jgi:hypothetical protein
MIELVDQICIHARQGVSLHGTLDRALAGCTVSMWPPVWRRTNQRVADTGAFLNLEGHVVALLTMLAAFVCRQMRTHKTQRGAPVLQLSNKPSFVGQAAAQEASSLCLELHPYIADECGGTQIDRACRHTSVDSRPHLSGAA